jgi:hypothetical protein
MVSDQEAQTAITSSEFNVKEKLPSYVRPKYRKIDSSELQVQQQKLLLENPAPFVSA